MQRLPRGIQNTHHYMAIAALEQITGARIVPLCALFAITVCGSGEVLDRFAESLLDCPRCLVWVTATTDVVEVADDADQISARVAGHP